MIEDAIAERLLKDVVRNLLRCAVTHPESRAGTNGRSSKRRSRGSCASCKSSALRRLVY